MLPKKAPVRALATAPSMAKVNACGSATRFGATPFSTATPRIRPLRSTTAMMASCDGDAALARRRIEVTSLFVKVCTPTGAAKIGENRRTVGESVGPNGDVAGVGGGLVGIAEVVELVAAAVAIEQIVAVVAAAEQVVVDAAEQTIGADAAAEFVVRGTAR